jgi:hypothetical protein
MIRSALKAVKAYVIPNIPRLRHKDSSRFENEREYWHQLQIARFLNRWKPTRGCWTHFPAGGHRATRTARWMKLFGMKPGLPDILIFKPCLYQKKTYVGLAIELKRTWMGHSISVSQRHWMNTLQANGWLVVIARGSLAAEVLAQECYPEHDCPVFVSTPLGERHAALRAALEHPVHGQLSNRDLALRLSVWRKTVARRRREGTG